MADLGGDASSIAIGGSFLAWLDSARTGVNASRFNGTVAQLPAGGDVGVLAADGNLLGYVDATAVATPTEKDVLVLADLSPR